MNSTELTERRNALAHELRQTKAEWSTANLAAVTGDAEAADKAKSLKATISDLEDRIIGLNAAIEKSRELESEEAQASVRQAKVDAGHRHADIVALARKQAAELDAAVGKVYGLADKLRGTISEARKTAIASGGFDDPWIDWDTVTHALRAEFNEYRVDVNVTPNPVPLIGADLDLMLERHGHRIAQRLRQDGVLPAAAE
ncbi:hypothetical protein CCC_02283 [Paramagnetospirillum magnetotacticum MS-1]|uniref:Uncharacterized protein n=2 Tax=Paramagnetospirillum magnetotacticum TaxID=188 RepID=A0A0C2YUN3_PARME|nr:hypothetical protein CCC_02283 [Paramagnetospirillum magnetotacticum MS-1]